MKKFKLEYTAVVSAGEKTTEAVQVEIIEAERFFIDTHGGVQFYNRQSDLVAACPRNRVILVKELKA